jgi:hypothetical protein
MAHRLTSTPTSWYVECKYCQRTDMGHERELRKKANALCQRPEKSHIGAYLEAELDRLDHAILNEIGQIEILTEIHAKTGCDCLTELQDQLTDATHLAALDHPQEELHAPGVSPLASPLQATEPVAAPRNPVAAPPPTTFTVIHLPPGKATKNPPAVKRPKNSQTATTTPTTKTTTNLPSLLDRIKGIQPPQ